MSTWQKEQVEAVRAIQGSGAEVAQMAARQTLSQVIPQILPNVRGQAASTSAPPVSSNHSPTLSYASLVDRVALGSGKLVARL